MFKRDDNVSAGENKFEISVSPAPHHGNSVANYH